MYLKENLKTLRKFKGLTQAELSLKTSINIKNIGAYEEGRAEPSIEALLRIARFFGLTADEILLIKICQCKMIQATEITDDLGKKILVSH
jgi:transcriptional regulator with XRE-family HTH domain